MRTWERSAIDRLCGLCEHRHIAIGEPVQLFRIEGGREHVRCQHCAGPAPADLPPLVARAPIRATQLMPRITGAVLPLGWTRPVQAPRAAGAAVLDFKLRAGGDREPGEEG